ncbi:helix-turn-helix transcriptional regulator [Candidatus Avelusimicrobium alvi]|uniref:helix-turn-helix transcriptional regulator n=1 Tax=Candidatus Avelusimicrobium alvi TaxID=3416221 RepID=UPI003D14CA5D
MTKRLLTAKELAEYIGSSEKSIRSLQCQGKIPSAWIIKRGASVRYDLVEVDKWIEERKQDPAKKLWRAF